ncbi:MAG: universal stress protein [Anaerolineales bacterium]
MGYSQAVRDFRRARRKAALERVLARLAGKSTDLLSYDDVRKKLKGRETSKLELKEISLDSIVGSVGRYRDFSRGFLPRQDSDSGRWARVKVVVTELGGLPPIEVYQIVEAYFVLDGNHRVSVAREVGATHIEAYVRQVRTKVPLSPDVEPDDLIIKAEFAEFLERTSLAEVLEPDQLRVTAPGQYQPLFGQIEAHREFLAEERKQEISQREASEHWCEHVYLPLVRVIREQGLLRDFPVRTETDLYVWISRHRKALEREVGWEIKPSSAAADLMFKASPKVRPRAARLAKKAMDAVTPDPLEAGPAPGRWREETLAARRAELFTVDILVPVHREQASWSAMDQALLVAGREGARLQGLHIVASEKLKQDEEARFVREEFDRRCLEAGIPGKLAIEVGGVARRISERARWADLVVTHLAHPPGTRARARLGSGFRTMILRCPTPILAVPGTRSSMNHALLAYDGSPKAKEALYLSTYLASRWNISLAIVAVMEASRVTDETLREAQSYAERHEVKPTLVGKSGDIAKAIRQTAEERKCDFFVMGGYGYGPIVEAALGSAVDHILRESDNPVLICR